MENIYCLKPCCLDEWKKLGSPTAEERGELITDDDIITWDYYLYRFNCNTCRHIVSIYDKKEEE